MNETVMGKEEKLSPRIYRRMEDRKAWNAYWQVVLPYFETHYG